MFVVGSYEISRNIYAFDTEEEANECFNAFEILNKYVKHIDEYDAHTWKDKVNTLEEIIQHQIFIGRCVSDFEPMFLIYHGEVYPIEIKLE